MNGRQPAPVDVSVNLPVTELQASSINKINIFYEFCSCKMLKITLITNLQKNHIFNLTKNHLENIWPVHTFSI